MNFSVSKLMGDRPAEISPGVHPLVLMERRVGVDSAEAAKRLGLSLRQYSRYRNSNKIPAKICLLVELGAMEARRNSTSFGDLVAKWRPD